MSELIHIYCDESCHLENDEASAMVLGAIWCLGSHRAMLARKVKAIKKAHGVASGIEIKWVKVSPAKVNFYKALIDLFFDEPLLQFRGLVLPDKQALDHGRFNQNHDDFYYKMWFQLLNRLIGPDNCYRIFLDIKDTQGQKKVSKLHEVLCSANYDFDRKIIQSIEQVHSHDVLLLQLADLFIGALAYAHRGLQTSHAKQELVNYIRQRSGLSLTQSTLPRADKFNLFIWQAQK